MQVINTKRASKSNLFWSEDKKIQSLRGNIRGLLVESFKHPLAGGVDGADEEAWGPLGCRPRWPPSPRWRATDLARADNGHEITPWTEGGEVVDPELGDVGKVQYRRRHLGCNLLSSALGFFLLGVKWIGDCVGGTWFSGEF